MAARAPTQRLFVACLFGVPFRKRHQIGERCWPSPLLGRGAGAFFGSRPVENTEKMGKAGYSSWSLLHRSRIKNQTPLSASDWTSNELRVYSINAEKSLVQDSASITFQAPRCFYSEVADSPMRNSRVQNEPPQFRTVISVLRVSVQFARKAGSDRRTQFPSLRRKEQMFRARTRSTSSDVGID